MRPSSLLLLVVGVSISRSFVLDAGAGVGLNHEASDLQILFGMTTNLGSRSLSTPTSHD